MLSIVQRIRLGAGVEDFTGSLPLPSRTTKVKAQSQRGSIAGVGSDVQLSLGPGTRAQRGKSWQLNREQRQLTGLQELRKQFFTAPFNCLSRPFNRCATHPTSSSCHSQGLESLPKGIVFQTSNSSNSLFAGRSLGLVTASAYFFRPPPLALPTSTRPLSPP